MLVKPRIVRAILYILPEEEGTFTVEVLVIDDDNATTSDTFTYEVMNVAPTIGEMRFSIDGIPYLAGEGWNMEY